MSDPKKEKKLIVDHIAGGISKVLGKKPGPTVEEQIKNYYKDSEPVGKNTIMNLGKKKKEKEPEIKDRNYLKGR
tara:strand:- start:42 stop:263 length:222 start_codon:yes stop_codon:yes gene_type:complete